MKMYKVTMQFLPRLSTDDEVYSTLAQRTLQKIKENNELFSAFHSHTHYQFFQVARHHSRMEIRK